MWAGKLAPPQMQLESARREALLQRFQNHQHMTLMLVISPPGFGKTTLLAQWRAQRLAGAPPALAAGPVAWLSMDEADRDVGRFFAYLLLALEEAGLKLQSLAALAREQALDASPERTLATLLQLLAQDGRRFTLILDDYHRAACAEVDALTLLILERAGAWLQLVVAARQRPRWPLAALKLRGLVHEFDAGDLVLSLSEAGQLLGADMDRAELALMHARTEGWAVALQLARMWLQRVPGSSQGLQNFSGRATEMAEYLAEQIVSRLSPALRDFLAETALLERFDADLADLVRGRDDSAAMLDELQPFESLLVPLDTTGRWFRYHHLLAEFLSARVSPRRARDIHRVAARWLAGQTDWVLAVAHALKALDVALATSLVHEAGSWELVVRKGIPYARNLLEQFGDVTRHDDPGLLLMQAYLHAKLGEGALALERLRLARSAIEAGQVPHLKRDLEMVTGMIMIYLDRHEPAAQCPTSVDEATARYPQDSLAQGTLLCASAVRFLAWGHVAAARQAAQAARVCMRIAASPLGENYSLLHGALALSLSGELAAAGQRIDEALALADTNFGTDSSLRALTGCYKAQHLFLLGQWGEITPWLEDGRRTLQQDSWLDVLAITTEVAWRVSLRRNGLDTALAQLEHTAQIAQARNLARLTRLVEAWRVDLLVQAGLLPQARQHAQAVSLEALLPLSPESVAGLGIDWRFLEAGTLALARLNIANGSAALAHTRLERAIRVLQDNGLLLPAWRLGLMDLVAQRHIQEGSIPAEQVRQSLEPLLVRGLHGLLLDLGPPLLPLLALIEGGGLPAPLISQVRGWQTHPPRHRTTFSAKEEQVLELLIAGQGNKAIARALDISENTVKFHLKQIFQKLQVDKRGAAVGAALQLGFGGTGLRPAGQPKSNHPRG